MPIKSKEVVGGCQQWLCKRYLHLILKGYKPLLPSIGQVKKKQEITAVEKTKLTGFL